MIELLSAKETTKRWDFLLEIKNIKPAKAISFNPQSSKICVLGTGRAKKRKRTLSALLPHFSSKKTKPMTAPVIDPFDCSSVTVLPTHDIVEDTVNQYLEEWKKLDDRKICQQPVTSKFTQVIQDGNKADENVMLSSFVTTIPVGPGTKVSTNTNHGGGWRAMEDRLLLPDGFDYNTKSSDQRSIRTETGDDCLGDIAVSLKNSTQRLSYRTELTKLFDSIPTCRELEEQTHLGHKVDSTLRMYEKTHNSTRSSPTCHALARLRMPYRHGLPHSLSSFSHLNMRTTERRQNQDSSSYSESVLLEFWRRQPKRCMYSGCHRMVMEFLASQTLWDVHTVLSNMAEDDLWMAAYDDKSHKYNSAYPNVNISMTEYCGGKEDKKSEQNKGDSQQNLSGCFFIENTFYTTGSVDYAKPIVDWIDGNKLHCPLSIRRGYLGINSDNHIERIKTMKRTKLSKVPFRPNIRYYHACHGDVETTVMIVDKVLNFRGRDQNERDHTLYPFIHDISIAPRLPAVPICDACQIYQSAFIASTNCKTTTGGPRSLCQECCRDLNLIERERNSVKLYRQWRDQANLSRGIAHQQSMEF